MDEKIKIAGVQMEPKIMEKEENLARCIELIRVTAKEDAKLIVFPECALTGYCYSSLEEALPFVEPIPGPSTNTLIDACVTNPWRRLLHNPDYIFKEIQND